jgi:hypothetical protein
MSPTQTIRRSDAFLVQIVWLVSILIFLLQSLAWIQLLTGIRAMTPWPVRMVTLAWLALCVVWVRADISGAGGLAGFWRLPGSWALRFAAATYLLMLLNTLVSFPSGFDAIHYHLILPLEWLRNGGIWPMNPDPLMSQPANAELLALPALAMRNEALAGFGNALGALVLAISVYSIGMRFTELVEAAEFAVALVVGLPIVVYQTFSSYSDLFGTSMLFAGVALFMAYYGSGKRGMCWASAIALGLSFGTKPCFWPYGILFFGLIAFVLCSRKAFGLLGQSAALLAIPALLWFVRNAMATGNPVYPLAIHAGPISLNGLDRGNFVEAHGTGVLGPWLKALTYPWVEYVWDHGIPFDEHRGLGPAFATFWIPSLLVASLAALRVRRIAVLVGFFALSWLVWWGPLYRVLRFGLPVIALLCIFGALFYKHLSTALRKPVGALLAVSTALGCLMCLTLPARDFAARVHARSWSRAAYYGYPDIVDQFPPGSRVLNRVPAASNFILEGRNLTNVVVTLPESARPAALCEGESGYAVTLGDTGAEDAILRNCASLVYAGVPPSIHPKMAREWRVYRYAQSSQVGGHQTF